MHHKYICDLQGLSSVEGLRGENSAEEVVSYGFKLWKDRAWRLLPFLRRVPIGTVHSSGLVVFWHPQPTETF